MQCDLITYCIQHRFQEERHLGILEKIMGQRSLAEHQEQILPTMVQVEMDEMARPVEKSTVEPQVMKEMKERVADVSGLVKAVEEKEKIAKHLSAKLATQDGVWCIL